MKTKYTDSNTEALDKLQPAPTKPAQAAFKQCHKAAAALVTWRLRKGSSGTGSHQEAHIYATNDDGATETRIWSGTILSGGYGKKLSGIQLCVLLGSLAELAKTDTQPQNTTTP